MPLIVFVAVSDVYQDDRIPEPGAKRSTQVPKFEYDARASVFSVAPTVMAFAARAGELLQAFCVVVAGGDRVGHAVGDEFWTA